MPHPTKRTRQRGGKKVSPQKGGAKAKKASSRGAKKAKPALSRKHGPQLNAVVSPELFNAFADHCRTRNQKRDRTVEVALRRYLRAEDEGDDKDFHVSLDDDAARRLRAFRRVRQMPDRTLLVVEALRGHIVAVLDDDVAANAQFEALLADIHRSEPN